jgi:hypothetical protein
VRAKKRLLILDDPPDHVDSENIKLKIGSRSLLYQLFSKRDLKFIKFWLFSHFQVVEHILGRVFLHVLTSPIWTNLCTRMQHQCCDIKQL